jgi:hypothetical protein
MHDLCSLVLHTYGSDAGLLCEEERIRIEERAKLNRDCLARINLEIKIFLPTTARQPHDRWDDVRGVSLLLGESLSRVEDSAKMICIVVGVSNLNQ